MIARGLQLSNHGGQAIDYGSVLKFNHHVTSWSISPSTLPLITYNPVNGRFTIPNASSSDYLITWTVSLKTSTAMWGIADDFILRIEYSGPKTVTEENFSCCTTATGIIKSFKILHIIQKTTEDRLVCYLINRAFSTMYLTDLKYPVPDGYTENTIFNATITIMSI